MQRTRRIWMPWTCPSWILPDPLPGLAQTEKKPSCMPQREQIRDLASLEPHGCLSTHRWELDRGRSSWVSLCNLYTHTHTHTHTHTSIAFCSHKNLDSQWWNLGLEVSRDHGETEAHTSKGPSPIHGSLDSCLGFLAAFSLGNLHQNYIFFSADFLIFLPIQFPFLAMEGRKGKMKK